MCIRTIVSNDTESWALSKPMYGNIKVDIKFTCRENKENVLKWLLFNNYNRCVYFVSDYQLPDCLYNQMQRNNLTYMTKSKKYVLIRDVINNPPKSSRCNNFMLFTRDLDFLANTFNPLIKHFLPFTNIFLFSLKETILTNDMISNALYHGYNIYVVRNNFFNKSLAYFDLSYHYLIDPYTGKTLNTSESRDDKLADFFGNVSSHPLFNRSIVKSRPFRISTFNCPPHVIVDPITQQ